MINSCRYCNSTNLEHEILSENHIHYGKIKCKHCFRFLAWLPNPQKETVRKSKNAKVDQVIKFHQFDKEFCFFCLRTRNELGSKETLTVDHIDELKNSGTQGDQILNFQVLCSACHKLKNWARLYMNWHLKRGEDDREI